MLNIANAWPSVFVANLHKDELELQKELSAGKGSDGAALTAEQRRKDEDDVRLKGDFGSEALKVRRTYPTLTYADKLTLRHGGREFRFMSLVGDARARRCSISPRNGCSSRATCSYPVPYFSPSLSQHARSLRTLGELDADVIIPGHGPAWRDREFLNLEADLLETVVHQVGEAVQKGLDGGGDPEGGRRGAPSCEVHPRRHGAERQVPKVRGSHGRERIPGGPGRGSSVGVRYEEVSRASTSMAAASSLARGTAATWGVTRSSR